MGEFLNVFLLRGFLPLFHVAFLLSFNYPPISDVMPFCAAKDVVRVWLYSSALNEPSAPCFGYNIAAVGLLVCNLVEDFHGSFFVLLYKGVAPSRAAHF